MTTEEIEVAAAQLQLAEPRPQGLEEQELLLQCKLYPYGFPMEVKTNSAEIIALLTDMLGAFEKCFDVEPIRAEIRVVETESNECPPPPAYRQTYPIFTAVADKDNYLILHFPTRRSYMTLSSAAMQHEPYLRFFFMESIAGVHLGTSYATALHAGFVSLEGTGVLLCGDSGAGKSTLTYACARSGWKYVTDDCSFLLHNEERNLVTGNCYRVRFRPSAASLFPEVAGKELTDRAGGKPSIELPTTDLPDIVPSHMEEVRYMVFLNRHSDGPHELVPYSKDAARTFLRSYISGTGETLLKHSQAVERLLAVDILELRYTDLDWAIERLRTLVQEGR
ncbi:aldolase [Acidicapsa ligni]|uniref:aldolase n=1 Tax=Acidicapsa ligni TaxID=542300 RepID=UPI0021E08F40|nr:aldolase [Acidicapsa ligni]